ncbi:MAG: antibiotic biosynthesis monooxygenase [Chloroflexi bacterium]|nr:antibiotic biosynthesis monooxygenase [Chloroflexota bacterium]
MISLHVYMNAKPGKEAELEAGIRDSWIAAMSKQPGFLRAALLKPFSDEALDALGARKPSHTFEVVSFWESEELRLEWVARPVHDRVFMPLLELVDSVAPTLQTVEHGWEL